MVSVKRIVLDILKPYHPTALELARAIVEISADYRVYLTVVEKSENAETLQIEVTGSAIEFRDATLEHILRYCGEPALSQ